MCIKTLKPFPIKKNIVDALKQIESINKLLIDKKKFPLVLGGEHSLTSGAIRPFVKKFGKLCLLHFDAHADLRNSYNGNKFSHASTIRKFIAIITVS
jgi:agmatinase